MDPTCRDRRDGCGDDGGIARGGPDGSRAHIRTARMTLERGLRVRGGQELDVVLGGNADYLVGIGHLVELVE